MPDASTEADGLVEATGGFVPLLAGGRRQRATGWQADAARLKPRMILLRVRVEDDVVQGAAVGLACLI